MISFSIFAVTRTDWAVKTAKPKAVSVLLHKRSTKPQTKFSQSATSQSNSFTTSEDRRDCSTPVSGRETPCERLVAADRIYRKVMRKEMPVKVAEIITGRENAKSNTPEELSKETYMQMNRVIQAHRSYKRAKSDMRNTRQRAWRYVNEFSKYRSKSVPPSKGMYNTM